MHHNLNIKDEAIFISDSHYNTNRDELYKFLLKIKDKTIITNQLFLMGDMFDMLSYEIKYFLNNNKKIINLINELSSYIEIIYFEGNHDFNLKKIFPKIKIIQRDNQNTIFSLSNNKKVSLAHGDIFTPMSYNIYTKIIRNKYILSFLNLIDINNFISKKINEWLLQKNIYHEFSDFNKFATNRIKLYNNKSLDYIIEGHFHQGKQYKNYINLPMLSQYYIQVKNNQFISNKYIY